jgi:NADH-quinone oxidoreductase subunit K
MVTLNHYLILSAILFAIGTAGVFRRNLITILLSIEISRMRGQPDVVAFGRALGRPTARSSSSS